MLTKEWIEIQVIPSPGKLLNAEETIQFNLNISEWKPINDVQINFEV